MRLLKLAQIAPRLCAAAVLLLLPFAQAHAGKTLDQIRQRGQLVCGVSTGVIGFSAVDSQGHWRGLDVDVCRAIAAAVLKDPNKVKYVPVNAEQRFTALQSGEVDLLSRNTTWTLTRDASLGLEFTAITYYDGQGFLVPKKLKLRSAAQLRNAEICVQSGTTTEQNLSDYFKAQGVNVKPVVFENFEASIRAFFSGRCQAYTTDASALAFIRSKEAQKPDDYQILPELISKEPLGPVVRRGDDAWFTIVKWVVFALIDAEEYGVTQGNVQSMKASTNPAIRRLLGSTGDSGKPLGLDRDWAARAVGAVGNYGEIFRRNVGADSPLKLARGLNALWTQGGLMYAPPIR